MNELPEAPNAQVVVPEDPQEDHLRRLVTMWGVLSDLSFGDLLLYVPAGRGYMVRSQVRPATGQTLYKSDRVGSWAAGADRPHVERAWRSGAIEGGDLFVEELGVSVTVP